MPSIYGLKPAFQNLLRPLAARLARKGVTANQVTCLALALSLLLGSVLFVWPVPVLFILLPLWLPVRMALNAVDGILAREYGQKSILGCYLNELADILSDAALYLPFVRLPDFGADWVLLFIFLARWGGGPAATTALSAKATGPLLWACWAFWWPACRCLPFFHGCFPSFRFCSA